MMALWSAFSKSQEMSRWQIYIPLQIWQVQHRLRDNTLLFPVQTRPSKQDKDHWKFLINLISQEGLLYVPLGDWERRQDQIYPFVLTKKENIIYKKIQEGWRAYVKAKPSSRRYRRVPLVVASVPDDTFPVGVLDFTNYIIYIRGETNGVTNLCTSKNWGDRFKLQVAGKGGTMQLQN